MLRGSQFQLPPPLAAMKVLAILSSLTLLCHANLHSDYLRGADSQSDPRLAVESEELRWLQTTTNVTNREKSWRNQHNLKRKQYQVEYGGKFVPLKWNAELKKKAAKWAAEIAKTCVNKIPGAGQNTEDYGVNSAVKAGTRVFQSPQTVMSNWEKRLDLGYPKNQAMTQVLWSGTKYLACADASSALTASKVCTVSACYYAKAGNCVINTKYKGNWTKAVVEAPGCSKSCPPDVTDC